MPEQGANIDLLDVARRYLDLTTPDFRGALRAALRSDFPESDEGVKPPTGVCSECGRILYRPASAGGEREWVSGGRSHALHALRNLAEWFDNPSSSPAVWLNLIRYDRRYTAGQLLRLIAKALEESSGG